MAPTAHPPTQGGMFHTFQGVTPRKTLTEASDGGKSNSNSGNKRITTPHACAECKRRKIRCDGQQPCGQCLSSRAPKRCFYDKHRQRVIPSRKTLEALSQQLEECRSVLKRLYPEHDVPTLLSLSRQELVDIIHRRDANTPESLLSPSSQGSPIKQDFDSCHGSDVSFTSFEQMPSLDAEWDDEGRRQESMPSETDALNAGSLVGDRQTSYLGASSIKAALMVMLKAQPQLRHSLTPPLNNVEMTSNLPVIRQRSIVPKDTSRIPWSWKGQTLIDAYFKRVHVFIPMLEEGTFRSDYLEGQRCDAPWLALLNMVFAMGSIVAMKSDDFTHIDYYNRAMEHITIDAFGSNHIETVQSLAIIGGYYLHYINRPNMANAMIGAAVRMASALGLHRESLAQGTTSDGASAETRRRTWWSVFCLDTWATTTTGRPSFGRFGPAININAPGFGMDQAHDSAQHAGILPLVENVKFCKIATQIQDLLAITPLVRAEDRSSMDGQLVNWYGSLPWLLRTSDPCAEPLYIARCIMKWRYQNLRMLLHRPILLTVASGSSQPSDKDCVAVETCREMAKATIGDISREWTRNQMSGWNAVWFLYQAAMIPLVSLFWECGSSQVSEWQEQVETVLELLEAMEDWSMAARRCREVVWRMYESSRQTASTPKQDNARAPALHILTDQGLVMNDRDFHLSPIGLESGDMMGLMEQQGLWDLDGMCWAQNQGPLATDGGMCDLNESMVGMDYTAMGNADHMMDPAFFVQ
ncbi:putative transcriptional regulatory protein-like protein [Emericellopsis cladophorae]|uniref:Transcriptional regulatory protein-like protein n=1 Tax=Emericellopsis cladophorae TaxID=2686198 RepID=A0A9P9Y400_9HYPO|nr:putative transcriptional regulatory protein-like protein [Emericellopsis cladophorae]KAI6782708.1 putative transcriptional regulatory protein-like protein [Emericellopsis cladophorae]